MIENRISLSLRHKLLSLTSTLCLAASLTAPAGAYDVSGGYSPEYDYSFEQSVAATPRSAPRMVYPQTQAQDANYISEVASEGLFCWGKERFPLKVFFDVKEGVQGFKPNYPKVLSSCLNEWVEASKDKLAWKEVGSADQADLVVHWTDHVTERANGTEAGNTKTTTLWNPRTNTGVIKKADMTLLTRLPDRDFSPEEVRRAYLHEVGHAFGIAGHSQDDRDIMYYAVNKKTDHLSSRDSATINHLYTSDVFTAASAPPTTPGT